ncbi:MAG TPA: MYG1 family protein [Baekduia sp.]
MRVATHPGNFHADDVFAIAALRLAHGDDEVVVVRTRDPRVQDEADARIDVGGRSDPATGDFDHHQKGGAGERPNGIAYASFGLVWRHVGERVAGSAEAAASVDERLVQGVDANDTGQTITESLVDDVRPMTVSGVVAALNPAWDEELGREQEDARFLEAVALAQGILAREVAGAAAFQRARELVRAAIARAEDPRIIELDANMPWREAVVAGAPEALYVMYPKSDGWGLQAVPVAASSFDNRLDLPAEWAGLTGSELAAATGVDDAIFAHAKRFYASASSRAGITALARLAMARQPAEPRRPS